MPKISELPDLASPTTGAIVPLTESGTTYHADLGSLPVSTPVSQAISTATADIPGLLSDVGTLQTDVGTLQTDVGTLQGQMLTAQGDITDLQSDVGTLQGEMTTAQNDISALQTGVAQATLTTRTAVTASSTAVDFTSIPSWVKRITVVFNGISTNGTSIPIVQIGDSGGFETSGYSSSVSRISTTVVTTTSSSGFLIAAAWDNTYDPSGVITLALINGTTNTWAFAINAAPNSSATHTLVGAGAKSLSATLDRLRITASNGTDTFDAGVVNILYE
jgi:outer membrane murein-binding lipoprotein Lpp